MNARRTTSGRSTSRNSGARRSSSTGTVRNSAARRSRPQTSKPKSTSTHSSRPAARKTDSKKSAPRGRKPAPHRRKSTGAPRTKTKDVNIKPPAKGTFRIIPIGGCEEVGRNMTIFEYGNDIIIHDIGMQFPDENMPGIDYIVPNIKYLKGKEKRVRAAVFSHGHLDHIGAAPLILEQLGYPTVIGMPLTVAMIKNRLEDYKKGSSKNLKTIVVKSYKDRVQLGDINLGFFQVEHSIMDSMGTILETPAGTALHPGDWTMERDSKGKTHIHYDQLKDVTRPSVLMLESLGALKEGRHATHEELYDNLSGILAKAPGRVIIATFSSQVERVKWLIQAAEDLGKKVALEGFSMKKNVEIAKELGYIKPKPGILIDGRDIDKYKDKELVVVCTGAQGEENAALNRIATGNHRTVTLRATDTVVFSSSVIPGNERSIQKLKDNIYRQSDNVIHGDIMDVHISGHSTRTDILDMLDQVKPDYFIPVFGNHFFLKEAKTLASNNGYNPNNIIVPDNGHIIDMNPKGIKVQKQKAPSEYVFVDGLGVTDSQHVVLRDRQVLAEDGMVVVIATVSSKTGKLMQNPDIISRGFVFLKDNRDLIEDIRHKVKGMVVKSNPKTWADTNQIRNDIRDKIGQFLYTKTQKRPMVLPVVIEV